MYQELILAVIFGIAGLIATFAGYYFYICGQLYKSVEEAIDNAENPFFSGSEKFDLAVNQLMSLIPTLLKPFIKRLWVERLVQFSFDKIESYAKKQVKKKKNGKK